MCRHKHDVARGVDADPSRLLFVRPVGPRACIERWLLEDGQPHTISEIAAEEGAAV